MEKSLGRQKTGATGTDNGNAKLNPEKVRAIRRSHGKITYQELADIYGVTKSTIAKILTNKTWKQVKLEKGD